MKSNFEQFYVSLVSKYIYARRHRTKNHISRTNASLARDGIVHASESFQSSLNRTGFATSKFRRNNNEMFTQNCCLSIVGKRLFCNFQASAATVYK